VPWPDWKLVADFTVLLTAKTMHALFGPSRRRGSRYETPAHPLLMHPDCTLDSPMGTQRGKSMNGKQNTTS
jgi:hypothetical protein